MHFSELDLDSVTDATIFLDVDGTLVTDALETPTPAARQAVEKLARHNDVYLASNGPSERTARIGATLGVPTLPRLYKPFPRAVVRATKRRARVLVYGDKFITDGLFALVIGAEFVKVESLRGPGESLAARLVYALDRPASVGAAFLALMRPQQWIKNLLVFAPLFFAGALFTHSALWASGAAFAVFCIAASGVYVLNDLFDCAQDRLHPTKKHRPLASGRLSPRQACGLLALLIALLAVLLSASPALVPVTLLYLGLNAAYSAWLKHIAVLDIICVASFYIMRIVAGGVATAIPLSPWIILCAFFAALFIVVGKRRAEYWHEARRQVLEEYSKEALDFMLAGTAALAIISYGLYSILAHRSPYLVYSTAFVALALFRILNRVYTHPQQAEAPETLLFKDPVVFLTLVAWALYVFCVFYFTPAFGLGQLA